MISIHFSVILNSAHSDWWSITIKSLWLSLWKSDMSQSKAIIFKGESTGCSFSQWWALHRFSDRFLFNHNEHDPKDPDLHNVLSNITRREKLLQAQFEDRKKNCLHLVIRLSVIPLGLGQQNISDKRKTKLIILECQAFKWVKLF